MWSITLGVQLLFCVTVIKINFYFYGYCLCDWYQLSSWNQTGVLQLKIDSIYYSDAWQLYSYDDSHGI